jgi:hypothetical protein
MYNVIVMACGYAESNMTSWLVYSTQFFGIEGFETMEEAIKELALDLYAKYYDDVLSIYEKRYSKDVSECCRQALIKDKEANFCSVCGKPIENAEFSPIEFREYIKRLHASTCNDYGDAESCASRFQLSWWPWSLRELQDAEKDEIIWIAESAELVLLDALYDAKPELAKFAELDDEFDSDWEQFKAGKQPHYS